jgi:chromosome segregation ATPase
MVLLSNKLDSIFKDSTATSLLDEMITKDAANPAVDDLTKKINTSLLSIKQDITNLKLQTEKLSTPTTTDEGDAELKKSIEDLSNKLDECCANMSEKMDHLESSVTVIDTQLAMVTERLAYAQMTLDQILSILNQPNPGDAK